MDHRIVQCFGTKRRPHKEDKACRRRFLWTSKASGNNFGRKGTQACPHCGTMPDFAHPFNQYLIGQLSETEAKAAMPEYIDLLEKAQGKKQFLTFVDFCLIITGIEAKG